MNQNQSGHVSSPSCFPSGDMIPYANKMLAIMQSDPRFAGKTFSQMDLLTWFGAEGRRWCSKQEMLDKLSAPLREKLAKCYAIPEETNATDPVTGAPIVGGTFMGRGYCLNELDGDVVQWMLNLLAWEMLGLDPSAVVRDRRRDGLPPSADDDQGISVRLPRPGSKLPGVFESSPDDPGASSGCSRETPFDPSTGYHWCETAGACLAPGQACAPAAEPEKSTSKTAIVLGVLAGVAVLGTAAYWYATRPKANEAASNSDREDSE